MSRIEAGIVSYTVSGDYFARVGADFDTEAVDDAILAEVNRRLPDGIVVERSGRVFADESKAEEARDLDWDAILGSIDVDQILADHAR
jgi:ribosomal protein L1